MGDRDKEAGVCSNEDVIVGVSERRYVLAIWKR